MLTVKVKHQRLTDDADGWVIQVTAEKYAELKQRTDQYLAQAEPLQQLRRVRNMAQLEAARAAADYESAAIKAVQIVKQIPASHWIKLGDWECPQSPSGECAYDMNDENLSGEDECVFCHQPNERK